MDADSDTVMLMLLVMLVLPVVFDLIEESFEK